MNNSILRTYFKIRMKKDHNVTGSSSHHFNITTLHLLAKFHSSRTYGTPRVSDTEEKIR